MQYLALIHTDEEAWSALSEQQLSEVMEGYFAFSREGAEAGVIQGGSELAPSTTATTVRIRNEETLVTDGPFAELKEALGGYFVLECDSIDEACGWAAKIPGAATGAIEVRPIHVDEEEMEAS
jgi:hypothetical protein